MSRPRVLDYDELYAWLAAEADDADNLAGEYGGQGDDAEQAEYQARARAFRDALNHIEFALEL